MGLSSPLQVSYLSRCSLSCWLLHPIPIAIPAAAEAPAAAELGGGNSSRTSGSDIASLPEKVIASAGEIKHHNETTIKRGPSLAPRITNIADVAPSPAGRERSASDSADTVVTPGQGCQALVEGLDGTTPSTCPFLPSQTSQLSPNLQCLGCLLLGFISMLRKRVRGSAAPCVWL